MERQVQELYNPTRNLREVERRLASVIERDRKRELMILSERKTSRHDQQTEKKEQMVVASQNVFHTQDKEIAERAADFARGQIRVGGGELRCHAVTAALSNRSNIICRLNFLLGDIAGVKRQGRDEFGLNFQTGKGRLRKSK